MASTQVSRRNSIDAGVRIFNVRDFGATGDGQSLDTAAVQAAIDACAADLGGTVLVPAGSFLIGPIELKTNVALHIAAGGTLLGTTDVSQYHPANGIPLQGDQTMGDGNVGLVYAANARNVTITGPGTIDGQGAQVIANRRRAGHAPGRPHLMLFYRCTNLSISNIYLYHSAFHTCRICNCDYVRLDSIHIFCRTVGNNDGFHFISAQHVNMTNCNVQCGDDACAMFGSCQFVTITNSSFSTRWSTFRFGGGIANNIAVSNCICYQVFGCPIKLRCAPGSIYENMSFSNLVFDQVTGPISIGAGPEHLGGGTRRSRLATRPTTMPATKPGGWPGGIVRNISFNNISGTVLPKPEPLDDSRLSSGSDAAHLHSAIILNGVDGTYLENISFNDIHLIFGGGGTAEEGARRELPQIAGEYFALGPIPAYGLYARNVHGLTLNNVRLEVATPDFRPAVILDKVHDATIFNLTTQGNATTESLLRFMNASEVLVTGPRILDTASVFLRVEGSASRAITIESGDLSAATTTFTIADRADASVVKMRT